MSASEFRIVTFCSHQPYLHLFHKAPFRLDVILLERAQRFLQNWDPRVRPLPANFELLDLAEAKRRAVVGAYQVALAHNINDYLDLVKLGLPIVLVMHTSLSSRILEERSTIDRETYRANFAELVQRTGGHMVFVTPSKQEDWALPGEVIVAGIDPDDYPPYQGNLPRLLRVTNHLKQRGGILGYSQHRKLVEGFELSVVGHNPGLPDAEPAASWEALKGFYQSHRALIHTVVPVMEDGFNLAVIEAMACGMPIVSTAHPTSPLTHGLNGYISADIEELRSCLANLMTDQALAVRLGSAARELVVEHFHYRRFVEAWRELLTRLTTR